MRTHLPSRLSDCGIEEWDVPAEPQRHKLDFSSDPASGGGAAGPNNAGYPGILNRLSIAENIAPLHAPLLQYTPAD